jgi:hypothetical protein
MKTLQINEVIRPVGEHPLLEGLSRVLHVNRDDDLAVIISVGHAATARSSKPLQTRRSAPEDQAAERRRSGRAMPTSN